MSATSIMQALADRASRHTESWARRTRQTVASAIACRVRDKRLLIPADEVEEVLDGRELVAVPGAAPWVCGVAVCARGLAPVVDLGHFLFGRSTTHEPLTKVLIACFEDFAVGFRADELLGLETLGAISQAPDVDWSGEWVAQQCEIAGASWPVLRLSVGYRQMQTLAQTWSVRGS